jgi:hypothetical protein
LSDATFPPVAGRTAKKKSIMALSADLPLYKDSFELLNKIIELVKSYPRFLRYNLGDRMVNLCLDMLALIYKANSSYDKVPVLTELSCKYQMLVMLFRVSVEQQAMTERQYAVHSILLTRIGKQVTSWRQYNERMKLKVNSDK